MNEDQILEFLTEATKNDCYGLVRKVFVIMNTYGGLRGAEMRDLKRERVKSVTTGYEIEYLVSKQLTVKKWNK